MYKKPDSKTVKSLSAWGYNNDSEAKRDGLIYVVKDERGEWVKA